MSDDLRTLAQAVVDAWRDYGETASLESQKPALEAAWKAAMRAARMDVRQARAILAALDAERAQGYAQAMGEVVEWCKAEACDEWRTWPRGPEYKSALADVARWAASAAQQPPQPLDRVQEPASRADGQQGRDEGEGV